MREDEAHWRYNSDHSINLLMSYEAYYGNIYSMKAMDYAIKASEMWPCVSRQAAVLHLLKMKELSE